jgi:hypothetical protein
VPHAIAILLTGLTVLLLGGCGTFMTQSEVTGVTETVFDDRLPGGIADYWNTCMAKTTIWPSSLLKTYGRPKSILNGKPSKEFDLWSGPNLPN